MKFFLNNSLSQGFFHFLMRRPCINCGVKVQLPFYLLCTSCVQDINPLSTEIRCSSCQNPLQSDNSCRDCVNRPLFWDSCHAVLDYNKASCRDLFLKYKFESSLAAEKDLSQLLAQPLSVFKEHILVHLPCGKDTITRLGFNPTARLLENCGLNSISLFHKRDTIAQKYLSREERLARNGFLTLHQQPLPQDILLVDDVMTTGSTFNEAARLLKEQGVQKVGVLSLFRD